ncbi:hypothetical protein FQN57_001068 [Myotisia sp. PD_48]|nr:hypothetical protein FQN57_001068 [Myotisia sp. PD_48]
MNGHTQSAGPAKGPSPVLAPDNILSLITKCLGEDGEIKNAWEAVALLGHACMLAVGFRLIGLGEGNRMNPEGVLLPKTWNATTTYSFMYSHSQSSMEYILKISRLGNNAIVFALAIGDDRTTTFDLPVKDFISGSAIPVPSSGVPDILEILKIVYLTPDRINDLIRLFKVNVIQKLAPKLRQEGYQDSNQDMSSLSSASTDYERDGPRSEPSQEEPIQRQPNHSPLQNEVRIPYPLHELIDVYPVPGHPQEPPEPLRRFPDFPPPGFDDEYDINRLPRGLRSDAPSIPVPLNIGERDLYPQGLGPHDPIMGHFGPQRGGGGGGMHPTFDDPMFGRRPAGGGGGGGGGGSGGGYNPQVPPGARYDPVGPGWDFPGGSVPNPEGFPYPPSGGRGGFGGFGGGFM